MHGFSVGCENSKRACGTMIALPVEGLACYFSVVSMLHHPRNKRSYILYMPTCTFRRQLHWLWVAACFNAIPPSTFTNWDDWRYAFFFISQDLRQSHKSCVWKDVSCTLFSGAHFEPPFGLMLCSWRHNQVGLDMKTSITPTLYPYKKIPSLRFDFVI